MLRGGLLGVDPRRTRRSGADGSIALYAIGWPLPWLDAELAQLAVGGDLDAVQRAPVEQLRVDALGRDAQRHRAAEAAVGQRLHRLGEVALADQRVGLEPDGRRRRVRLGVRELGDRALDQVLPLLDGRVGHQGDGADARGEHEQAGEADTLGAGVAA